MGVCLAKLLSGAKPIPGWSECYITPDGEVFRVHKIAPYKTSTGYLHIKVMISGEVLGDYVHRLMAKTFIPNPCNLKTIDHIDGDKQNNRTNNLRWMSLADNVRAYFAKDYQIIDPDGVLWRFNNINKFAREKELDNSSLAKVLKGKISQTKGWTAPRRV